MIRVKWSPLGRWHGSPIRRYDEHRLLGNDLGRPFGDIGCLLDNYLGQPFGDVGCVIFLIWAKKSSFMKGFLDFQVSFGLWRKWLKMREDNWEGCLVSEILLSQWFRNIVFVTNDVRRDCSDNVNKNVFSPF